MSGVSISAPIPISSSTTLLGPPLLNRLPQDLLPLIFSFLTPQDKFSALPHLCRSLTSLLHASSFKSDSLIVTPSLLYPLASSPSLRSLLSLIPSLTLDLRPSPTSPSPTPTLSPFLLPLLFPLLRPHVTDPLLLSTVSVYFATQPDTAATFALFALLSYAPPPLLRLSSFTLRCTSTPLTLQLSPLSFPSLTSLTLQHAQLDATSLTPLLHLPSLLHLDLSSSTFHHTTRHPLSSLLASSPLPSTLLSFAAPTREFWGKLDTLIPALATPKHHPPSSHAPPSPSSSNLEHLSPCGHVSLADLGRLSSMRLHSLTLDGSWMFANDFLMFTSSLTGDEWRGLQVLLALDYDIQHSGGLDLPQGVELTVVVTSALCAFMRGLAEVEVLRLALPPYALVTEAFASSLFRLDRLACLELAGPSFTSRAQSITPDTLAPLSPAAFLSLRLISLVRLGLSDDALAVLVRAAPALTSLSLTSCFDLTGNLFSSLSSAALVELSIDACEGVSLREEDMRAGGQLIPLPSLRSLHINLNLSYAALDLPGLTLLASLTPNLRTLSLQSTQLLHAHLLAFAALPHLVDLSHTSLSDDVRALYECADCCISDADQWMEKAYQLEAERQRAERAGWVAKAVAAAEADLRQRREEEGDGARPRWRFKDEEGRRRFFAALEGGGDGREEEQRSTERGSAVVVDELEVVVVNGPGRSEMRALEVGDAAAVHPVTGWRRLFSCGCCG